MKWLLIIPWNDITFKCNGTWALTATFISVNPCSQPANWTFSQPYGMHWNSQSYNWFSVCHPACYRIWKDSLPNWQHLVNPSKQNTFSESHTVYSFPFNQFYPWVHQRFKGKIKTESILSWLIWKFRGQPLGYWWLLNCCALLAGHACEIHQHSTICLCCLLTDSSSKFRCAQYNLTRQSYGIVWKSLQGLPV